MIQNLGECSTPIWERPHFGTSFEKTLIKNTHIAPQPLLGKHLVAPKKETLVNNDPGLETEHYLI